MNGTTVRTALAVALLPLVVAASTACGYLHPRDGDVTSSTPTDTNGDGVKDTTIVEVWQAATRSERTVRLPGVRSCHRGQTFASCRDAP